MSSFFSFGRSASSSKTSLKSVDSNKEPVPETSDIYTTPLEGIKPNKKWEYDAEQLKKIDALKEYTKTIALPESDPYYFWEQRFLADPGTHPRYMRAAKWKPEDAKKRIKGTMEWRREFKPELIEPGDVGVEAETGKIILSGFDNDARPILYLRPGRENTKPSPRQIRHMIYHLERAIDLAPPGQEQVCIIVDYKSATSGAMPSIGTGLKVLSILQNHYVERLGRGLVVNMPWWINTFFGAISAAMDPITRDKIRFNPDLTEFAPAAHLDVEFGGAYHLKFDHALYWKTITEFCHIAPDGTRADAEGKRWYPPSGNGILAASQGLFPKKGSVSTGDVTTDPAEGIKVSAPDEGEKIIGVDPSAETTNGTTETAASGDIAATNGDKTAEAVPNGDANGLAKGVEGLSVSGADTPTQKTVAGAPEGDVVFDHPPSKSEIREARESLDKARASVDSARK